MKIKSKRSDIVVVEHDDGATLMIRARNPLVSWFVSTFGVFLLFWPLTLLAYGFSVTNYGTVLVAATLMTAVVWLTWYIGWRQRQFQIVFSLDCLQVGRQRFDYSDIQSHGVSRYGGDVVDTVSVGVPRNITIGPQIYIETGGRHLTITVALKDGQAKKASRLFTELLDAYHSR